MTAIAGGRLVGRIVVVHTEEGKQLLQIKQVVNTPMLTVSDSSGTEYIIVADDYERASANDCAQFFAARAESILAKVATWN